MDRWTGSLLASLATLLCLTSGCQPAGRYSGAAPRSTAPRSWPTFPPPLTTEAERTPRARPLAPDLTWVEPVPGTKVPDVPLVFVHEGTAHDAWTRLPQFWNVAAWPSPAIRIKVPLGLDDPTPLLPASNPPTLAKWQLGKRLFFDASILSAATSDRKVACATCHPPAGGFTDRALGKPVPGQPPTPSLLNSVYLTSLFGDGRASALEQAAQRSADDERDSPNAGPEPFHVWRGVVRRLRDRPEYVQLFKEAFGGPPTQDALGKALATYLRTLLSGDSVYDRARLVLWVRSGQDMEARDFETALDPASLASLADTEGSRDRVALARQLHRGYELFRGKAGCIACHRGATFSDHDFHNAGVGDSSVSPVPGSETGRFAVAPLGAKNPREIGAYRTPTLRSLPRAGLYFHTSEPTKLSTAVAIHTRPGSSPYLDPEFRDRGVQPTDVKALVLFLRALEGRPPPAIVTDPASTPPASP